MDVSVLIVSYNTKSLTLQCLRTVFAKTVGDFEVILLDNASSDGTGAAVREAFPQVKLIESGQNLGFAAGNNAAAKQARGEFLLLLNPDTALINDAIDQVADFARANPDYGIVGGRTYAGDGSLNYNSCHGLPTLWSMLCSSLGLSRRWRRSAFFNPEGLGAWPRDTAREVPAVTGCFMFLRRSLWDVLGGFDDNYFMYLEETDLCARARQRGTRCAICPDAELFHYEGQSDTVLPNKLVNLFASKSRYCHKHWSRPKAWLGDRLLDLWILSRLAGLTALRWTRGRSDADRAAVRQLWNRRGEFQAAT